MAIRKRHPRSVARTLLIFGEGKTDRAFCLFLKEILVERGSGVKVTVDSGTGGAPNKLIKKVKGKLEHRGYDHCAVMMDTDFSWPEKLPKKINKTPIHYVRSDPCIEGVFLWLLNDPDFHAARHSCQKCKHFFHKKYLRETKKYDKRNDHTIFKKERLLKGLREIPDFARLLDLMGVEK